LGFAERLLPKGGADDLDAFCDVIPGGFAEWLLPVVRASSVIV
jgi:hypothetical protein